MNEKTIKCAYCGDSYPESEVKEWVPHHASVPFLSTKHYKEPLSGFRCRKCSAKSRKRFYIFLLAIAVSFIIIAFIST